MLSSVLAKLTSLIDRIFVHGPENMASVSEKTCKDEYICENDNPEKISAEVVGITQKHEPLDSQDSGRWWNHKREMTGEETNYKSLDCLNSDQITSELNRKIDNGEFPLIDIPDNTIKIIHTLNTPDFSYSEVASIINRSPGLAGELIKVVNSPIYNRGIPITNLNQTLARLGKSTTKALLFLYSSKVGLEKDPYLYKLSLSIVDHSYSVGVIASYLSQRYFPDPDLAFMAGLLHDIGKLGIMKALAGAFRENSEQLVGCEINEDSFSDIFPGLHERAGAFIASRWLLDPVIITAIAHHHDYATVGFNEDEDLGRQLACLINLSDTIAKMLGHGQPLSENINIFLEPAIIDLAIDRTSETFAFFNDIPKVISFKLADSNNADQKDETHKS